MASKMSDMLVLIAGNKTQVRQLVKRTLRDIGFQHFLDADTGNAALEMLQEAKDPVDLVLCMYDLPDITGVDVLREVRDNQNLNKALFIMMSSETKEANIAEAISLTVDAFIMIPFTQDTMIAKLRAAISKRKNPPQWEIALNLGKVHLESGQLEKAALHFQDAQNLCKREGIKSPRVQLCLGMLAEAEADLIREQNNNKITDQAKALYQEAIKHYNRALQMADKFLKAHNKLVNVYRVLGQDNEATKHLGKITTINPHDLGTRRRYANMLKETGQNDKAAEQLKKLAAHAHIQLREGVRRSTTNHAEVLSQVAEDLKMMGRDEDAEEVFNQSAKLDPNNVHSLNRLGMYARRKGDPVKAMSYYQRALKLNPKDEGIWYNLALAHIDRKDYKAAQDCLVKAVKINNNFSEARQLLKRMEPKKK